MKPAIDCAVFAAVSADQRGELERFITERFRAAYGARVGHFCAQLVSVGDSAGRCFAAAGYTAARSARLSLEQYLDAPVEALLGRAAGRRITREQVAEVGNLAAAPGMGRALIPLLGRHLHAMGFRWVAFTATRELRNAFRRLALEPLILAPASPSRLPDGGAGWGSYYQHDPRVVGGPIAACLRVAEIA